MTKMEKRAKKEFSMRSLREFIHSPSPTAIPARLTGIFFRKEIFPGLPAWPLSIGANESYIWSYQIGGFFSGKSIHKRDFEAEL
jgi:hypothetical protein